MPREVYPSTTRELASPGMLKAGDRGTEVKRLQEWLFLRGVLKQAAISQTYDRNTEDAVQKFRKDQGLADVGALDQPTWDALIAPLVKADGFAPAATGNAHDAVVATAQAHLAQGAIEIVENLGPWVRYYTRGRQGTTVAWCQGFASSMVLQAFGSLGKATPFEPVIDGSLCLYVPTFVEESVEPTGGLLSADDPDLTDKLHPGAFCFVRGTDPKYEHVGLIETIDKARGTFVTIDGNWSNKVRRMPRTLANREYDFGIYPA